MTSQSPRIYTYKITFEEVPYYYYGMHEEKVYGEEYWGSPITNRWCWELYTPKKQILETFSSREDAAKIERRLIKPFYNTDKWCLNANCGGFFSLDTCSRAGKIGGRKIKNLGIGIFALTLEQRKENYRFAGKHGGKKTKELGLGIHKLTEEEMSKNGRMGGKIGGNKSYELGVGVHVRTPEKMSKDGKMGGKKSAKLCLGAHRLTKEERQEIVAKTNSQKWKCLETGFITTPGALTHYQKARGIDTSKRKRIS